MKKGQLMFGDYVTVRTGEDATVFQVGAQNAFMVELFNVGGCSSGRSLGFTDISLLSFATKEQVVKAKL